MEFIPHTFNPDNTHTLRTKRFFKGSLDNTFFSFQKKVMLLIGTFTGGSALE